MNRRKVIRWELAALTLALILLLFRALSGPGGPGGVVMLSQIDSHNLAHAAFSVEQPAWVAIEAVGSFERSDRDGESEDFAAYGWIINRESRDVVWLMDHRVLIESRGTLTTARDTLVLNPGTYDTYFTSYGNSFYSRRDRSFFNRIIDPDQHWQNDESKWMLAVYPVGEDQSTVKRIRSDHPDERAPSSEKVIWTSASTRNNERRTFIFEVTRPLPIRLYAVGELNGELKDYGWIENIATEERLWEMTEENTRPAGGADENRLFDGEVRLEPGVYRAIFVTDRTHAFGNWRANPPLDPAAWGLTLSVLNATDSLVVQAFDPWRSRQPIIRITEVPNDNMRSAQFAVEQPLDVIVHAVGEMHEGGRYDYAWITNDQTAEHIWEMRREQTISAGGADKNRQVTDFLRLEPGTYTLYYQTDDSHAYEDWNAEEPDYPERWGVTLFPVAPTVDESAIRLLQPIRIVEARSHREPPHPGVAPVPPVPPVPSQFLHGDVVAREAPLGNEANVESRFELSEPTTLQIYATGEITLRGRYDYGWIESADTGERVWEMTWQNTEPAGGDDRNRRFVGKLNLQPGAYIVRFQTDLSHAYNDFGNRAPADADSWGIMLTR